MRFRSFIRTWLLRALSYRTGEPEGANFSPAQAISALVSLLMGSRVDFTAAPGKLAILIVAFDELKEDGWCETSAPCEFAAGWSWAWDRSDCTHAEGGRERGQDCGAYCYACAGTHSHRTDCGAHDRPLALAIPSRGHCAPVLEELTSGSGSRFAPPKILRRNSKASPRPRVVAR